MTPPLRPKLRPLELVPHGNQEERLVALRDPEGFGSPVVMAAEVAFIALLMDGQRTLAEIQEAFKLKVRTSLSLDDLEQVVEAFDEAYLLESQRFDAFRRRRIRQFLDAPMRPATHCLNDQENPEAYQRELDDLFAIPEEPGAIAEAGGSQTATLRAIVSPHIDFARGAAVYARTYRCVVEQTDARLFIILGTSHTSMEEFVAATRKDFQTPLGTVQTDTSFLERLYEELSSSVAGAQLDLFRDEAAHRFEHSIEFQVTMLQYFLGQCRPPSIVPLLIASFQEFIEEGITPEESPELQAFIAALRKVSANWPETVCFISGADLAHIGPRFGDPWPVDPNRAEQQAEDDRVLLEAVCRGDAAAVFRHVADQHDRRRICGLAPIYVMLEAMGTGRGQLLRYGQALEPDGSACVSFAGVALHGKEETRSDSVNS